MCLILGMQIHTSRMTLADDVNLEEFVMTKDEFSGADIKAICTEAGLPYEGDTSTLFSSLS